MKPQVKAVADIQLFSFAIEPSNRLAPEIDWFIFDFVWSIRHVNLMRPSPCPRMEQAWSSTDMNACLYVIIINLEMFDLLLLSMNMDISELKDGNVLLHMIIWGFVSRLWPSSSIKAIFSFGARTWHISCYVEVHEDSRSATLKHVRPLDVPMIYALLKSCCMRLGWSLHENIMQWQIGETSNTSGPGDITAPLPFIQGF